MKTVLQIALNPSPQQAQRLHALQAGFADVCNALAPVVRDTRCWNRVALHHMTYRDLRARFPQMGSQMVCNAIYSVSRACRAVYQAPGSPFNLARLGNGPLPLIRFAPTSPVFFDRHTLSIRDGHLSMFTLDGRMRFELNVEPVHERRFRTEKLSEIVLLSSGDSFQLQFSFSEASAEEGPDATPAAPGAATEWPEYVLVLPESQPAPSFPGDMR